MKKNNFRFPGGFNDNIYIKEIIYNNPATIVLWSDGTKTISKCLPEDVYSKETGVLICIFKKLHGTAHLIDLIKYWVEPDQTKITLRDVRRLQRQEDNE